MIDEKEPPCPSCGEELLHSYDHLGKTYQCVNHTCLELFDASEIEEHLK